MQVTPLPRPILEVRGATLQYRTPDRVVTALLRASFKVFTGDRFVLLGPSGCGKSTLLRAVAGFMPTVEGDILIDGHPVGRPGPDRIMVFQEFDQLLPWKTVRENVVFPLVETGLARAVALEKAAHYLDKVGLSGFADLHPHRLSGGMKQRVAIARAMALEPRVLLMDEPFAALDALTRRKMQEEVLRLWAETGTTLLFVTHSIEEAVIVGSRILLLSPHPGRVRAELNVPSAYHGGGYGDAELALSRRIHDLLFGAQDAAPEARRQAHG